MNCIPTGLSLGTVGRGNVYRLTTDEAEELKVACLNYRYLTLTLVRVKAHAAGGDSGYNWARHHGPRPAHRRLKRRWFQVAAGLHRSCKVPPQPRDLQPPVTDRDYELTAAGDPGTADAASFSVSDWTNEGGFYGVGFVSRQSVVAPHGSHDPDVP